MVLHCAGCAKKVRNSIKSMPERGEGPAPAKPQPPKEEDAAKKQPPTPTPTEEKKPTELQETTVLLKIRLHCDGCADRIRRRIYKIKGVKHVELEGNAKDEVKVTGTMDVPAMVAYLTEKLNRAVEAVAPGKKDKGAGDEKKDNKGAGDGEKKKDKAAAGDHVVMSQDKGKGIEVAGPSMASAAASVAPAPARHTTSPPPTLLVGRYVPLQQLPASRSVRVKSQEYARV
uniref:HMA domain-containing protein n=1 Tax=Aegilops tauschii TaxID=37682 RepID=M8B808_AEGTA